MAHSHLGKGVHQNNISRNPEIRKHLIGKLEWCDYIQHFLNVCEWNECDEPEITKMLKMAFDGTNIKLLCELNKITLNDFKLLVRELDHWFDPSERAAPSKVELKNRIKTKN